MTRPRLGQVVVYRSEVDNGPGHDVLSPAVVLRTRRTTVLAVMERWTPEQVTVVSLADRRVEHTTVGRPEDVVSELPDDTTIDILVHGLGKDYRRYAVTHGPERGQWQWSHEVDQ